MLVLPKEKTLPCKNSMRFVIFFGRPKAGKSSAMAALDSNLIIDLENGYKNLSALVIQARNINDFGEIAKALQEEIQKTGKYPYKYITIDNATRLEEMCMGYAITLSLNVLELYVEIHIVKFREFLEHLSYNYALYITNSYKKENQKLSVMKIDLFIDKINKIYNNFHNESSTTISKESTLQANGGTS